MAATAAGEHAEVRRGTVVVTGAFSYSGRYIARRRLDRGVRVRTLTNHPSPQDPLAAAVPAFPLDFSRPDALTEALTGADVLVNTYWVRFPYRGLTYEHAVRNSETLFHAARAAGVRRIVHVSIANPSLDSPLGYYRGKAQVEAALRATALSHAILRPTVLFGREDILVNNIAWFVRRFPVFVIPGDGRYRLQPIYVEDFAALVTDAVERRDDYILDAVGPETFTFEDLVRLIARTLCRSDRIIHPPAGLAWTLTWLVGRFVGDVVLTREEYRGLMDDLLVSPQPPPGTTRLSEWLAGNADRVGSQYASELARHFS